MHIKAERTLRLKPDRLSAGKRDGGDLGELDGDLDSGVAGADHHNPLPAEGFRPAVMGSVQQGSGEVAQAGKVGNVGPAEAAGGRDQRPGGQPVPAGHEKAVGLAVPHRI